MQKLTIEELMKKMNIRRTITSRGRYGPVRTVGDELTLHTRKMDPSTLYYAYFQGDTFAILYRKPMLHVYLVVDEPILSGTPKRSSFVKKIPRIKN